MVKVRTDMGRTNPVESSLRVRAELLLDPEDEYLRNRVSLTSQGYLEFRVEGKARLLHRFLLGNPKGYLVDHKNGNRLDNRKKNLRMVDRRINVHNVEGARKDNSLGVRGVRMVGAKFSARIRHEGAQIHLGTYASLEEAVCARLKAEKELVGVQPRREAAFKEASCGLG